MQWAAATTDLFNTLDFCKERLLYSGGWQQGSTMSGSEEHRRQRALKNEGRFSLSALQFVLESSANCAGQKMLATCSS